MKKLKELTNKLIKSSMVIQDCMTLKKPCIILTVIYAIGISAILRANYNYIDDMGRVYQGYQDWDNFSRYISCFLSNFVHGDSYLTDVSPLPQLLATFIMALAGVLLVDIITQKDEKRVMDYVALIPMGLSPYFLECLSYKYDAPYMAISVLVSIYPLLFWRGNRAVYVVHVVIGTILMCTTYQASSGIFPMLIIVLVFKSWNNRKKIKEIINFVLFSAFGYILGMLVFKMFIMQEQDSYVSTGIFSVKQLVPGIINNLKQYYQHVYTDFKIEWIILIGILAIVFTFVYIKESKQKRALAFVMVVVELLLLCIVAFGVYIAMEKITFAPRTMYGFGVLISVLSVEVVNCQKVYMGKLAVVLLSWLFVVFSFTYGNALDVQNQYTEMRTNAVIEDINDLGIGTGEQSVAIVVKGSIGQAPVLKNMPQDYQMLNRLVPVTFCEGWFWGTYKFFRYYGLQNVYLHSGDDVVVEELPILKDTMYHTIRGTEDRIVIQLK